MLLRHFWHQIWKQVRTLLIFIKISIYLHDSIFNMTITAYVPLPTDITLCPRTLSCSRNNSYNILKQVVLPWHLQGPFGHHLQLAAKILPYPGKIYYKPTRSAQKHGNPHRHWKVSQTTVLQSLSRNKVRNTTKRRSAFGISFLVAWKTEGMGKTFISQMPWWWLRMRSKDHVLGV